MAATAVVAQSAADDAENGDNSGSRSGFLTGKAETEEAPAEKIVIEVSRNDDDDDASDETPSIKSRKIALKSEEIREPESDEPTDDAGDDEKKPRRSGWWRK